MAFIMIFCTAYLCVAFYISFQRIIASLLLAVLYTVHVLLKDLWLRLPSFCIEIYNAKTK